MFTRDKIVAVNKAGIRTTREQGGTPVRSSISAGPAGGAHVNLTSYTNSQYNYYLSGLLPATPDMPDSSSLAFFYRDIYLHDNTAGSCVDIQSTFPFSDWELRGLEESELEIYENALERLNLRELLPQASVSYLTDGFYAGSLVFDPKAKNFMDILTHDALQCGFIPSPFNNVDPSIHVSVSGPTMQFLNGTTEYAKQYMATMPKSFVDLLHEGSFTLDPVTTLFLGRRGLTDRAYQSYLHRVLPMYLIEKTMFRGTLIEANRRQRAMTHIAAGDDTWTPTSDELSMLVQQFQSAEQDPLGGWVSTRNSIQLQDLRPGGDFWKWTDMTDVMVAYKLRALGISEALLSGDASYAAAESAYSTFLETTNAYRTHLTNCVFYKKLFPLIGIANKMFKDGSKQKDTDKIVDFLFNAANRNNLKQPVLHWHKDLTAKAEDNMMDMLDKVAEKGVPIPMKMWLAAAGVDKDTLIRDAKEDQELKDALGIGGTGPIVPPPAQDGFDGGGGEFDGASANDSSSGGGGGGRHWGHWGHKASAELPSSVNSGARKRLAILDRDFNQELFDIGKNGQKKHIFSNADAKAKDIHHRIAKIAAKAEKDPNYKESLRKRNLEKMGRDKLNTIM